jgi:hypothetical protein
MNQSKWGRADYGVFRWREFPSILIFDTADYAVQDRMLKRLAFFSEKKGYRGTLASDAEIADQHGWNAHDYRAETLADFFNLAAAQNFPLLKEEIELRDYCAECGIIVPAGKGWKAGEGAIVSISRESPDYLRRRFMVHEGYHGVYFIDADFRDFTKKRWEALKLTPEGRDARSFILQFFDYQKYDIKDSYLVRNEFMAYLLQQSANAAVSYFGETLPSRVWKTEWRHPYMPAPDEDGKWPGLGKRLSGEAQVFSDYVNRRWGFAAGRLWP